MRKLYSLASILLLASLGLYAQSPLRPIQDKTVVRCYTFQAMEEYRALHPEAETDAQFEAWIAKATAQRKSNTSRPSFANYTVPMIFHIISGGEAVGTTPNIDAKYVKAQVMQLNKSYANTAGSPYAASANTGLTFALAQKNPSGTVLTEPGIERINYNTKGWTAPGTTGWSKTYIDGTIKPATIWDPNSYINIWIVPLMSGGIIGYATFPTSSGLTGITSTETSTTAGVAVVANSIGSTYTKSECNTGNPYNEGKTLVHELGHFFGLRHIWGDATCGDDYVNDTPIAQQANYGTFTHPKANSCGTADEMFENYMDYTDDLQLNTFTTGQVDRIQTVMLNSPRRNTLSASNAGFVLVPGANTVQFTSSCTDQISVSEAGNASAGNVSYRDINVVVSTEGTANAPATVTLNATGTAVAGVDYDLLTSSLAFATGESSKAAVLRVYDNPAVTGDKQIALTMTIVGSGVAAGTEHQSLTITIRDDDNVTLGQNPVNLLDEKFETAGATIPTGWTTFTSTGAINKFVVSANGNATSGSTGTGQCAHITNNTTTKPNSYSVGASGAALLASPLIDPSKLMSVGNLTFNYKVKGRVNLDYGYALYMINNSTSTLAFWGNSSGLTGYGPYANATAIANTPSLAAPTSDIDNRPFNVCFYFASSSTAGSNSDPGLNVDNVLLTGTPYPIETAVASSYSYRLSASVNNLFRSANNKAIATLANVATDVTGVTVAVSEAGNDRPNFNTEAGTYMRSRKVFTIASSSGALSTYTATFYLTSAEIAAWGTSATSLKLLQVLPGTDFSQTLNLTNSVLVTPTVVDKLTSDGYIAFTGTFSGAGQFAVVDATTVLPLRLLSFTGTLQGSSVNLKWSTTDEVRTKGFDVERSNDGSTYEKIGFVAANNQATNTYGLIDENISRGNKYFYRLKMIDLDGRFTYSNIVTVNSKSSSWATAYPNPVKDVLAIQNNRRENKAYNITITEVGGKVVYRANEIVASTLEINSSKWCAGTYIIGLTAGEEHTTLKVVKQ